jgi:hypothetical protein
MDKDKKNESGKAAEKEAEKQSPEKNDATSTGEERTIVKNANAAGLGAMERSDQNFDNPDPNLANY